MTQLEPCPFCGSEPVFLGDDSYGACSVFCANSDCPAEPSVQAMKDRPEEAIAAWNRRSPSSSDERVKGMEDVPMPDPAVMRDYIIKLTAYWMDNPGWTELANEARGYVAALSPEVK